MSTRSERRRAAQGKGGDSDMTKLYMILGIVAVIGVGAVGYSVGRGTGAATQPVDLPGLSEDLQRLAQMAQGVAKGDDGAPVTIIEFGDYQCPGCMAFNTQVKPAMELSLVESGKAQFIFYDFPITSGHPNAFLAARAARCAEDQDRFWEYHDNLFRTQSRWSTLANPAGLFVEYSRSLDMDDDAFEGCLMSDRHADLVTANMQLGEIMGVGGTPWILIEHGGTVSYVQSDLASITQHVNGLLEEESGDE